MTQRGDKRAHLDVQTNVPAEHGRSRRSVSKRPKAEDCHMAETNKCAHPACKCLVSKEGPYGKYCSKHCVEAAAVTELKCDCKHPACR